MKKLPDNIKREHILQAIKKIGEEGVPAQAHSSTYDLLYNDKRFPPKLVLAYANLFANGKELDRNKFEGGKGTECFKILEDNGFDIIKKNNMSIISETLMKFLEQAKGDSLRTKDYIKTYSDLRVSVSFGMSNLAHIPWISFLADGQATSNGIYPVYLLYKNFNLLILAYGVSEKAKPEIMWNITDDMETISSYLKKKSLTPKHYGNSYVYAAYDISKTLDFTLIEKDLDKLINQYKSIIGVRQPVKEDLNTVSDNSNSGMKQEEFKLESFIEDLPLTHLKFSSEFVSRFVLSLLTKPFVILSGLAGSGKTQLAKTFAYWICEDVEKQVCMVSVGADWANRDFLIGYPNALQTGMYVKPDNGALDVILRANNNPEKPYFLILDEMNLSYVERYFADFLSVMESDDKIPLMKDCIDKEIPTSIRLPHNLFIIGTINVDETTYMFSPKVLDRANVIEFRIMAEDMQSYLENIQPVCKKAIYTKGGNQANSFVKIATESSDMQTLEEQRTTIIETLQNFFLELKKIHAEFGYRTASDIFRFMALAEKVETELKGDAIVDAVIIQKMLPKLHGSRKKVEPVLKALWQLCIASKNVSSLENAVKLPKEDSLKYPLSAEKIWRMYHIALDNGFTSFAEA